MIIFFFGGAAPVGIEGAVAVDVLLSGATIESFGILPLCEESSCDDMTGGVVCLVKGFKEGISER
jgi:hypothetical protein